MCLAIPGKIISIHPTSDFPHADSELDRMGKVDFDGVTKEVSLAYVPEARVGDFVLVHVGFALQKLDTLEAEETLSMLKAMERTAEE